jgi:hypothetical protein
MSETLQICEGANLQNDGRHIHIFYFSRKVSIPKEEFLNIVLEGMRYPNNHI